MPTNHASTDLKASASAPKRLTAPSTVGTPPKIERMREAGNIRRIVELILG
jgi:hypothetical protein